jgi:hypothetical protein
MPISKECNFIFSSLNIAPPYGASLNYKRGAFSSGVQQAAIVDIRNPASLLA